MKVKDLIKILQTHDQESLVVLSSDAEGNSYSEARNIESYYFDEDNSEIRELEDDEDEDLFFLKKCVVIWP